MESNKSMVIRMAPRPERSHQKAFTEITREKEGEGIEGQHGETKENEQRWAGGENECKSRPAVRRGKH